MHSWESQNADTMRMHNLDSEAVAADRMWVGLEIRMSVGMLAWILLGHLYVA